METISNTIEVYHNSEKIISPKLNEYILLWVLFWTTVAVVYMFPQVVGYIFIIVLFVLFAVSKRDYFWLAFFLLLTYAPFGFFIESSRDSAHRLPLFIFGPGLSFSTSLMFLLIGLTKALTKNTQIVSFFSKHYKLLIIYLALLVPIAIIIHETEVGTLLDGIKQVIYISFLFIIYKLIDKREDKYKFILLLVPFVFLFLLDAFYFLITGGDYVYNFFNPDYPRQLLSMGEGISGDLNIRFVPWGFVLSYLIFIFSLSYSFISKKRTYFLITALSAFIIVIAAAVRSWFIIYSIALIFFLFYSSEKLKYSILIGVLFLLLMFPLIQTSTGSAALSAAFDRISTVFSIGKESSAATKSLEYKVKRHLPSQLQYIRENPLTGWEFKKKQGIPDVGNFALIVDIGFVGFFIFLWFWFSFFSILKQHIHAFRDKNAKNAMRMLIVLFLGILLSHFTTNAVFIISRGVFFGTFIFLTEFIIQEAKIYDQKVIHENERIENS